MRHWWQQRRVVGARALPLRPHPPVLPACVECSHTRSRCPPLSCSGYDFGYLLKILTCQPVPPTEAEFFELLNIYFPNIFDIKYLMKFCDNMHGGLNKLAELLEVGLARCMHGRTRRWRTPRRSSEPVRVCGGAWHVLQACARRVRACALQVQRIGPQHQAGSDSLLTSFTFIKLANKFFHGVQGASRHCGILYGLGADVAPSDAYSSKLPES